MNKKIIRCISLIMLVLLSFFAVVLPLSAAASEDYNFTIPADELAASFTPSDILSAYLSAKGESIDRLEEEFVDRFSALSVSVSNTVPTDKISISYDASVEALYVKCESFSYSTDCGTVAFLAREVTLGGTLTAVPENGCAAFLGISEEDSRKEVSVEYSLEVSIRPEDINELISLYYETALYTKQSLEYDALLLEYNDYLHERRLYEDAEAKYQKYLDELDAYEKTLYLYENYSEAVLKYENDYKRYLEYCAELRLYEDAYREYLSGKQTALLIERQLLALDIIKTPMTDGRDVYNTIFGPTVDSVLENKSLITSSAVGVDEAVVDLAAVTTANVRAHLKSYFKLKTIEEKYQYYTVNYDSLCRDFRGLTSALAKLYSNKRVRGILIAEGKNRKYVILLAQLSLVSSLLIDGEIYDLDGNAAFGPEWIIDGESRDAVLENKAYAYDTDNAEPVPGGLPPYMTEPQKPLEVAEPILPPRPQMPAKPKEVAPSGEPPRPRPEPTVPTASERISEIYSALSREHRQELSSTFENGEISSRDMQSEPFVFTLQAFVKDSIDTPRVKLRFYDTDRKTLIYECEIAEGTSALFLGTLPTKSPDANFDKYSFSHWENAEGERASLSDVSQGADLYPCFSGRPKLYTIGWDFGDKTVYSEEAAGSIPTPPQELPRKENDEYFAYSFIGWDRPLSAVDSSVTYTAIFDKEYIVPTSEGGGSVTTEGGNTSLGLYGFTDSEYDIEALIFSIAGKTSLTVALTDANLFFSYSEVIKLKEAGIKYISASVLKRGNASYLYRVELLDKDGAATEQKINISVTLPAPAGEGIGSILYTESEAGREYVSYTKDGNKISFELQNGLSYNFKEEYRIYASKSELAEARPSLTVACPGDRVYAGYFLRPGVSLAGISLTTAEGESIELSRDGYFIMPNSDIRFTVNAVYRVYTVSFSVGGRVIHTERLKYGEMPKAPLPARGNDELYSYRFIGWNMPLTFADSDITYEALFEKTPIPPLLNDGLVVQPRVMRLLIIVIACVSVILLLALALVVFLLVRRAKRRRKGRENPGA